MRVFVTGASGFVGSAVVEELLRGGHEVLGLARSDNSAKIVEELGAEVHRGDIEDLESLKSGAHLADSIIHTGFNHDFTKFKENCEKDRVAISAMGSALVGTTKPFIVTSGIGILSLGRVSNETDVAPTPSYNPRVATEEASTALRQQGVNVSLVRLPPSVHGAGDHAFIPLLMKIAQDKQISVYPDNGQNRWCAVHRLDAAKLFRFALEKSKSPATYHAVAEEGLAFKDIAETIGRKLQLPAASLPKEEAAKHFDWFAHFAAMNVPSSSQRTREALGWKPRETGLLADIESDAY